MNKNNCPSHPFTLALLIFVLLPSAQALLQQLPGLYLGTFKHMQTKSKCRLIPDFPFPIFTPFLTPQ